MKLRYTKLNFCTPMAKYLLQASNPIPHLVSVQKHLSKNSLSLHKYELHMYLLSWLKFSNAKSEANVVLQIVYSRSLFINISHCDALVKST